MTLPDREFSIILSTFYWFNSTYHARDQFIQGQVIVVNPFEEVHSCSVVLQWTAWLERPMTIHFTLTRKIIWRTKKIYLEEIAARKVYLNTFLTNFKKEGGFQFDCILFNVCYLKAFEWVNRFWWLLYVYIYISCYYTKNFKQTIYCPIQTLFNNNLFT